LSRQRCWRRTQSWIELDVIKTWTRAFQQTLRSIFRSGRYDDYFKDHQSCWLCKRVDFVSWI
jgi:hypothetical protein